MDLFWKATALALIAAIICTSLNQNHALLVALAATVMIAIACAAYLQPVLDFFHRLEEAGQLQSGLVQNLLKALGVSFTAEIAAMVCADAGRQSVGKMMQLAGAAAILYLSIPVCTSLLELVQDLLAGF